MRTVFFTFFLASIYCGSQAQTNHPLEPISAHYQVLSRLNGNRDPKRAWMDTVRFPWAEYGQSAISNSLWRTVYLSPADESKLPDLIHFPANSSDQTRAELDFLLDLERRRTKAQISRAEYIANLGSWPNILNPDDSGYDENKKELYYISAEVIGDWPGFDSFPATTKLLMGCIQDIRVTEFRLKWYFKRARPYHLEPKLHPLARIHSPSFASGHSLWAFTEAFLFSELIPEKRAGFLHRAEEVRWSRELMGIHYPSDNEASRVIAWHLLQYWYKSPTFRADLNRAKKEWAHHVSLNPH